MIDWIKNIFARKEEMEILDWKTKDSILVFLQNNIASNGTLKPSTENLPDEKKADDEIKFAPGLLDSLFAEDDSDESKIRIRRLSILIDKVSKRGDKQSKSDFYREITENDSVVGILDQFLEKIVQSALPVDPYLYGYALDLATKTNNRNSVKFGIAILGLCQNQKPIEQIKVLGLHDEFTVFSTVALINISDNLIYDLWELAKLVDGWGKIQLVDRLAELELTEELREWLVLEGYKNSIMYEYLALTCAVNGELNKKLQNDSIQPELFKAAGEIIVALIDEGPADGMSEYSDARETIQSYIRHAKKQKLNITDFNNLHYIKDFLEDFETDIQAIKNWSESPICINEINNIVDSKLWTKEVESALESTDSIKYWNGKQASKKLGIDITQTLWNRLEKYPLESTSWHDIINYTKSDSAQSIVDKAIELLPLEELSTGPKNSMGAGPDWHKHQSLDYVITLLKNHPKLGEKIILAGLESPVIRNRNMTLKTLENWKQENWSDAVHKGLATLEKNEPTADVKENLGKLLKGEELS